MGRARSRVMKVRVNQELKAMLGLKPYGNMESKQGQKNYLNKYFSLTPLVLEIMVCLLDLQATTEFPRRK